MKSLTRTAWVARAALWYADCFHLDMPAATRAAEHLAAKLGDGLLTHVPEEAVTEREDERGTS